MGTKDGSSPAGSGNKDPTVGAYINIVGGAVSIADCVSLAEGE